MRGGSGKAQKEARHQKDRGTGRLDGVGTVGAHRQLDAAAAFPAQSLTAGGGLTGEHVMESSSSLGL